MNAGSQLCRLMSMFGCTLMAATAVVAQDVSPRIKIALAGDSTVTDKAGWGLGFASSLTDKASCMNLSAGGRSSKSFRAEGLWQKILDQRPDFILIQFGHNDQPGKGPDRETDPRTSYRENLALYVEQARASGAVPVIVTSLSRRLWAPNGQQIQSILTDYVEAAKWVAQQKGVSLIDLHSQSILVYEAIGQESCAVISPRGKEGELDHTHLNTLGGELFGTLVAQELRRVLPELRESIREIPMPKTAEQWQVWLKQRD